ncbi:MAG: CRISPR-associated endonuclease Cas2 [Candidatus Nitrosotenuis sp.]
MYVIVVYDIEVERIDAARHILKQYLTWIQNSAFEGEITQGLLEELRLKIFAVIEKEKDSVIVYTINNPSWLNKQTWGRKKNDAENIL